MALSILLGRRILMTVVGDSVGNLSPISFNESGFFLLMNEVVS